MPQVVNDALAGTGVCSIFSPIGWSSIAPEKLIRATLLQAFYSIRSERPLIKRLENELLFGWFVDTGVDYLPSDRFVFSKNRDPWLEGDIAAKIQGAILAQPKVKHCCQRTTSLSMAR